MGKQYIKTLLKAILPGKYHCIPHRTRSEIKDYGTYRKNTRNQEREDRKKEEEERKALERERREWENELDEETKPLKKEKSEERKKEREKEKKSGKENKKQSIKESEEQRNQELENPNKNDEEPVKESGEQGVIKNKKLKDKKRRKDESKRQSKEKQDINEKSNSQESQEISRESKRIENDTKKIVVRNESENSKGKQCEISFEIANVVDNGYPSKPIVVVLQMKKVFKDEDDGENRSNRSPQEYERYSKSVCGSDKCPVRKNESNTPVTKEDFERIEKIALEYLRDSTRNTPIYTSCKKCRKRQESGQSSRTDISAHSWPTRSTQYNVRSITMLKQNYGKYDEQQNSVNSDDKWALKKSRKTHFKEKRDSDELISIGEYWEFISDQNMTGYDNESTGTSIIIDDEYKPNEQVDDTNKDNKEIHQKRQLPIWSKVRYHRFERPASAIQQKQSLCGEFYRLDMPVCLLKNKCQYCREYEMLKQGEEIDTLARNNNKENETIVNPKCVEYCTVMDMLDQAKM